MKKVQKSKDQEEMYRRKRVRRESERRRGMTSVKVGILKCSSLQYIFHILATMINPFKWKKKWISVIKLSRNETLNIWGDSAVACSI